ncbi:hypothetical protein Taro_047930 [Colocasia esculenta]|uniref:Uncharacterized protein n=1 Tax=Colocasia esculenta TaxID=4460 RepID=A0A843WUB6_COLES|nr:hypothetical protein [Colocasia esculenta]
MRTVDDTCSHPCLVVLPEAKSLRDASALPPPSSPLPLPSPRCLSPPMAEEGGEGSRRDRRDPQGPAAAAAAVATTVRIPPYMKAVSGSMGGVVEACCLQPIDVIKTRLQLDRTGTYKGIVHCGSTVCRTEGVRALWKGLTPFATHLTLKYALRMGSNALFQSAFKDSETGVISQRGRLMSGFGAGVLEALVIVTPFEASFSCSPTHPPSRSISICFLNAVHGRPGDHSIDFDCGCKQRDGYHPRIHVDFSIIDFARLRGTHCLRDVWPFNGLGLK